MYCMMVENIKKRESSIYYHFVLKVKATSKSYGALKDCPWRARAQEAYSSFSLNQSKLFFYLFKIYGAVIT